MALVRLEDSVRAQHQHRKALFPLATDALERACQSKKGPLHCAIPGRRQKDSPRRHLRSVKRSDRGGVGSYKTGFRTCRMGNGRVGIDLLGTSRPQHHVYLSRPPRLEYMLSALRGFLSFPAKLASSRTLTLKAPSPSAMGKSFSQTSGPVSSTDRLSALRALLKAQGLDALVVPTDDSHASEYVRVVRSTHCYPS